ncbi:MAG: short-subunit dehydrogenase [Halieaceae bacterium]|jgi:short-subunit dehydrogenase
MSDHKKTALVTGASAGLGAEFCRQLADTCEVIIAVARRGDRMHQLAEELADKAELHVVEADLTAVEGVTRAVEALRQKGPVDYLVNNAGFGTFGGFVETGFNAQQNMVRLHIDATLELCRAAAPYMAELGGGYIINVASIGGFLPMKNTAVYGATKAFLISFSSSLQQEVAKQGTKVQCLCPGFTDTELHDLPTRAGFDKSRVPQKLWMDPAVVVRQSLLGLSSQSVLLIPGEFNADMVRSGLQGQLDSL